ncbi:MAG: hypothetical protein ABIE94_01305 [archaeon]
MEKNEMLENLVNAAHRKRGRDFDMLHGHEGQISGDVGITETDDYLVMGTKRVASEYCIETTVFTGDGPGHTLPQGTFGCIVVQYIDKNKEEPEVREIVTPTIDLSFGRAVWTEEPLRTAGDQMIAGGVRAAQYDHNKILVEWTTEGDAPKPTYLIDLDQGTVQAWQSGSFDSYMARKEELESLQESA